MSKCIRSRRALWGLIAMCLFLAVGLTVNAAEVPILTETFQEEYTTSANVDPFGANNETPLRVSGTGATGFTWGGYFAYSGTSPNRHLGLNSNWPGVMQFLYDSSPETYFYTVFATDGSNNADTTVDLSSSLAEVSVTFYSFKVTYTYRYLLREGSTGDWYASEPVSMPAPTNGTDVTVSHTVSSLAWYPLDAASNTNLNLLAGGDEQPIVIGTTAGSPDFSAVDGGGYYQETGAGYENPIIKINDLEWSANTPLLGTSGSPVHPLDTEGTLVLGPADTFPPASPYTGSFTLENTGMGTLTIQNIELLNTGSYIDYNGAAPSLPQDLDPGDILNLGMAFNPTVALDSPTTASLIITSNNGGVAGSTTTLAIEGNLLLTGSVFESFNVSGNADVALENGGNETPQAMFPPPDGSGYTWGGHTQATGNNYQCRVTIQGSGGRLLFYSMTAGQDDATFSANYHGSYAYTIFDSVAGTTPDRQVDLEKIEIRSDQFAPTQEVRYLVRDANDQWFLTQDTFPIDQVETYIRVDVDDFTGWLRVNAAAEAEMNQLDTDAQVAIDEPGTLSAGTPDLTSVTGGGVYVETGDVSTADRYVFTIQDLNFIQRPSENDRLTITATDITSTNVADVPYRRLDILGLNAQVTSGTDVLLNGLTVNVTPNDGSLVDVGLFADGGGQLTTSSLSGGTATLVFPDDPYTFVSGPAVSMLLMLTFNESAAGVTYDISLGAIDFDINEDIGGTGDAVIMAPADPAQASVDVVAVNMPDKGSLASFPVFMETWDDVTGPLAPDTYDFSTADSGPVDGSDVSWTYAEFNGNTHSIDIGAGFNSDSLNVMAGVQTKDLSVDPYTAIYGPFSFSHALSERILTTDMTADIVELGFRAMVTQANYEDDKPSFASTRTWDGRTNVVLRIESPDGQYFDFTLSPLLDNAARAFSVSSFTSGESNDGEVAPAPLKTYDDADGVGTYDITVGYAAYDADHTRVRVTLTNIDTSQSMDMTTLMDGEMPLYIDGVSLWFGKYTNLYVDNVYMTLFGTSPNPTSADHWILY